MPGSGSSFPFPGDKLETFTLYLQVLVLKEHNGKFACLLYLLGLDFHMFVLRTELESRHG